MDESRDSSISNLKAIMLFAIILNHSFASVKYINSPQIIPVHWLDTFSSCLPWCLGAFFFISGYYTHASGETKADYVILVKKRISSLFVPYFLWNLTYVVIFITGSFFVATIKTRCHELQLFSVWGVLNGLFGITHHPADGPLWYVRNLFFCVLLYPFFRCFCKEKNGWMIIVAIAVCLGFVYPYMAPAVTEHLKPYIIPAFCFGIYFREHDISLHVFEHYPLVGISALVLSLAVLFHGLNFRPISWMIERRLIYLLVLPSWMMISKYLAHSNEFYNFIVRESFYIYASHALFCTAVLKLLAPRVPESPYKLLILSSAFLVVGLGLIFVSGLVLHKLAPKIYSLLARR